MSIKDILMEKDKSKISFTRVTGAILILYYIFSSTYLLFKNNSLTDIPTNLFILICGLYGINRAADIFQSTKQSSSNQSNSGF